MQEGRLCSCLEGLRLRVPGPASVSFPCFPVPGLLCDSETVPGVPCRGLPWLQGVQCPLPHSAGSDLQLGSAFPPASGGSFTRSALLEPL